jgi:hypothetical protein
MKYFSNKVKLLITVFIILTGFANAQTMKTDLTQGRYLENTFKNNFVGNWVGRNDELQMNVTISKEKRHFKRGNVDVYLDYLVIKINKFIHQDDDLHSSFKSEIALVSTNNQNLFSGTYKDPVSNNNVNLSLKTVSKNKLILSSSLPEMDPNNKWGEFILPKSIELLKQTK